MPNNQTNLPALPETHEPKLLAKYLKASAGLLPRGESEARSLEEALRHVDIRPTIDEISVEVAFILAQRPFLSQQPKIVQDRTSELWFEHLEPFPIWAIQSAISWWFGPGNPKCNTLPQPGNIAARAREEASPIIAAKESIRLWEKYKGEYPYFLQKTGT